MDNENEGEEFLGNSEYEKGEQLTDLHHRFKNNQNFWTVYNGLVRRPNLNPLYTNLCIIAMKSENIMRIDDEYSQAVYMKGLIASILNQRPELNMN